MAALHVHPSGMFTSAPLFLGSRQIPGHLFFFAILHEHPSGGTRMFPKRSTQSSSSPSPTSPAKNNCLEWANFNESLYIFLFLDFSDFPILSISRLCCFPDFIYSPIFPISRFAYLPIFSIPRFRLFPDFADSPITPTKFDDSADRVSAVRKIFRRRLENGDFADPILPPWL